MSGAGEMLGNYRVISELGRGGMGAVYLAEHTLIGKRVAAKILLPQFSQNPEIVERFFNEARAATQIRHPGIVEIFDFGRHPNGSAYLIMELLDGESLASRLARDGGRLEETLLLEVTRQLASALRAAHDKEIIHRDLKPDNAFLVPDPDLRLGLRVKLLDFGIAKLSGAGGSSMKTRTGTMMGTPLYMSPEQCRGAGRVDTRSDIYSLGCMMFEMACGHPPYLGEGPGDVIGAHIFAEVPRARALAPSLSPAVDELITRMLQKAPDARVQSMAELLSLLEAMGMRHSGANLVINPRAPAAASARTITPPPRTVSPAPSTTLGGAAAELSQPVPRTRSTSWVPALAALVVAGLGGGWYFLRAPSPEMPAAAPPPPPVEAPAAPRAPPQVSVSIDSHPSGAEVYRMSDGVRLGHTPFTHKLPQGDEDRLYLLRLRGYRDATVTVSATEDVRKAIKLERQAAAAKAPKAPAAPRRAKNATFDPFEN